MRKIVALLVMIGLVFAAPLAYAGVVDKAQDLAKDKLVVGVDYDYTKSTLKGDDNVPTRKLVTNDALITLGYKLSDYLTPYGIMGSTWVNEKTDTYKYVDGGCLTWGFGLTGKVLDLPKGALLSYDVNRKSFNSENEKDGYKVANAKWNTSLMLSKEFAAPAALKVKSVTPYVGYKYTNLTQKDKGNGSNTLSLTNNMHSCLLGTKIAINDSIEAKIGGSIGGENGVSAGVTYKF